MAIKVKSSFLQVRIDPDLLVRFQAVCEGRGRTASDLVRGWVVEAVRMGEKRAVERLWNEARGEGQRPAPEAVAAVSGPVVGRGPVDTLAGLKGPQRLAEMKRLERIARLKGKA